MNMKSTCFCILPRLYQINYLRIYIIHRYTLLVGKPPFETSSLKDTYQRIKRNEYYIPSKVSHTAQLLIIKLLRPDPATRPGLQEVLDDDFFKGFTPSRMPVSSLTMVPRFATGSSSNLLGMSRRPLNELNSQETRPATTAGRRDKAAFLEKVSNRRSLGIRVCGAESKLIMPGEAVAEELKDENQEGTLRLNQAVTTLILLNT